MSSRAVPMLALLAVALLVLSNSVYIVKETERAVLLQFGEVVNPDVSSGLHFKIPVVNVVRKFDARILTFDSPPERFLTVEKKPLDVDFFAKWRVMDTAAFYEATGGEEARAHALLGQRIKTGLRNQFGERTMYEVVSGERDLLMVELTERVTEVTQREFGVEVIDIRAKRIDLPDRVSQSVFDRMKSERQREAQEQRSTGREQAEVIRAAADREVVIFEANAYREAQRQRGEGEARAAAIYAEAYSKDLEFYAFLRSLQAYQESFADPSDVLVLDPNSDFFRYLRGIEVQPRR